MRPESAPDLAVLVPGAVVALVCADAEQSEHPVSSCGKTQLAVRFAEELWRCGQVELLAWVEASSRASVLSGYVQAAAAAGVGVTGRAGAMSSAGAAGAQDPAAPAEQVAAHLAGWLAETSQPWLMVLDDLRDAADLDGLWPRGPAGRVLITCRDKSSVQGEARLPGVRIFPIGPLSTREALSYLTARLRNDPDQRHGAIDLAITLAGDPSALTHASAVIATTDDSCRDYQRRYTGKLAHLAERQSADEPPAAPAVTWRLSAERADQLLPGGTTQLLLAIAAVLDGQAMPAPMFATRAIREYLASAGARAGAPAASAEQAWEAVAVLEDTGLVSIDSSSTPQVVRLSRQIASMVLASLPGRMREQATQAAADALLEMWPQPDPQPCLAASLRSCTDALQRTAGSRLWATGTCHPLLLQAGHSLDADRLTGPAVRHWTDIATTSDRMLGSDNPHTHVAAGHLAQALVTAGRAAEAVAWWQWVAAGRAHVSGVAHPGTLEARVNLGRAMTAAGQHDAVTALELVVSDYERIQGPSHPETFGARNELAAACQAAGRATEAIGHYRRVVADLERLNGARHPATLSARDNLAAACLAAGRPDDAISCHKKALADRQRALGADHLDTITARRNLAAAYRAAGKLAAALRLQDESCADYERVLGAAHPDTLACRAELASAYNAAGRLSDAATLLRDTLTRCEQGLSPSHPLTQAIRQTLASLAGA